MGETNCAEPPRELALESLWGLWVREQAFLQGHARHLVHRGGANVDDLTDEALGRAISATLRGAGPHSNARAWLRLLLDRTAVDQHRRRRRFQYAANSEALEALEVRRTTPEGQLIERETSLAVNLAFQRLPKPLRHAFELRVHEGLTYAAIADLLAITPDNARKRVQLARSLLRASREDSTTAQASHTSSKLPGYEPPAYRR